jgi:hypothetical protein
MVLMSLGPAGGHFSSRRDWLVKIPLRADPRKPPELSMDGDAAGASGLGDPVVTGPGSIGGPFSAPPLVAASRQQTASADRKCAFMWLSPMWAYLFSAFPVKALRS